MQFRQPERLEKWIAYDGALGAELLVAEADAADNIDDGADAGFDNDGGDGMDGAPEIGFVAFGAETRADGRITVILDGEDNEDGLKVTHDDGHGDDVHDGRITVSLPDGTDADDLFPWLTDSGFFDGDIIGSDGVIQAGDIYFEISNPDGGSFGFYLYSDVTINSPRFIQDHDIAPGTHMMFIVQEGGETFLREYVRNGNDQHFSIAGGGGETTGDLPGGKVEFSLTEDGGIRFHLLDTGRTTAGHTILESLFRSITFTRDAGSTVETVGGFDISVYYRDGVRNDEYPHLFSDDNSHGMYNPENENVVADSTDPDFEHSTHGNLGDGGGGGGEGPDPGDGDGNGGEDELPFTPPGDEGGDESGEDAGGDDPGGEGDSGSDSGQGDGDLGVVFEDNYDDSGEDGSADNSEAEAREDAAPVEQRGNKERAAENAADARQLELARDMEFMLTAVRNERAALLGLIGRLQAEYLAREPMEYGELRGYLRRLFDMGGREQETVNRIIDAMNREMEVFRGAATGRRDGMLAESVRELIDSAERHSGEMGAYSQAIEAVADLLAQRREAGLPPPPETEMEALFAAKYEEALAGWLASAERIDPMGRELTAAQRVGGMVEGE